LPVDLKVDRHEQTDALVDADLKVGIDGPRGQRRADGPLGQRALP
jgi:hypothetical protein